MYRDRDNKLCFSNSTQYSINLSSFNLVSLFINQNLIQGSRTEFVFGLMVFQLNCANIFHVTTSAVEVK